MTITIITKIIISWLIIRTIHRDKLFIVSRKKRGTHFFPFELKRVANNYLIEFVGFVFLSCYV